MTFRVYKYEIPIEDEFMLIFPEDAKVLHVGTQHGVPHIWVLVEIDSPDVKHFFRIAGTGHDIDSSKIDGHIGTFMMKEDNLVWHLFERL